MSLFKDTWFFNTGLTAHSTITLPELSFSNRSISSKGTSHPARTWENQAVLQHDAWAPFKWWNHQPKAQMWKMWHYIDHERDTWGQCNSWNKKVSPAQPQLGMCVFGNSNLSQMTTKEKPVLIWWLHINCSKLANYNPWVMKVRLTVASPLTRQLCARQAPPPICSSVKGV